MVEKFAPGADYRLLVVGDRVVAAARREPAHVVGNGTATIRQLVDEVNLDPRRSEDHATVLTKIKLCPIALTVLERAGIHARLGAGRGTASADSPQCQLEHWRYRDRRDRSD